MCSSAGCDASCPPKAQPRPSRRCGASAICSTRKSAGLETACEAVSWPGRTASGDPAAGTDARIRGRNVDLRAGGSSVPAG